MDEAVTRQILADRRVACVVTDRRLVVQAAEGETSLLGQKPCVGCSVLDVAPELIGSESALADVLAGKLPRVDLQWINRDGPAGHPLYLNLTGLPHHNGSDSRITGLILVAEDVTAAGHSHQLVMQQRNQLRLLQDQLERQNQTLAAANAELRRLDEMKSIFVSVAAHELRSPLTSLRGYMEMLLDGDFGPLADAQVEVLRIVERSSQRLIGVVNALLDVASIEAGRVELHLRPVDLPALIERVVAELQPDIETRQHTLRLALAGDLPAALCDEARVYQIVCNLLSNAIKYTPRGGMLTLSATHGDEPGAVRVTVTDTGIGLTQDDQARLFTRFYRSPRAADLDAKGTGLGLYIARSIAELHGGRLWVDSQPGRGSAFHLVLPSAA